MGTQAAAALRAAARTGAPVGDLPPAPQAPDDDPGDRVLLGGLPPGFSLARVALSSGATGHWARVALTDVVGLPAPATPDRAARRYAPLGRWVGTGLWLELASALTRAPARSAAPPAPVDPLGRTPVGAAG